MKNYIKNFLMNPVAFHSTSLQGTGSSLRGTKQSESYIKELFEKNKTFTVINKFSLSNKNITSSNYNQSDCFTAFAMTSVSLRICVAIIFCLISFSSCIKYVAPSDSITTEVLTSTTEGLTNAVNGAYALFKDHVEFNGTADDNNMYLRQYYQLSDFASDDITCGQVTEDPLFYSFSLDHSPTQTNTRYFWYISYKIINDCNTVIAAVDSSTTDPTRKQLLGECYFLRAFTSFYLTRLFARPY